MSVIDIIKKINDLKSKHDSLKNEILIDLERFKSFENEINEKIKTLDIIEKKYISLVENLYENK